MKWLMVPGVLLVTGLQVVCAQSRQGWAREHTLSAGVADSKLADPFILSSTARGTALNIGYTFSSHSATGKRSFSLDWNKASLANEQAGINTNSFKLCFSQGFSLFKSRDGRLVSYWGYSIDANPVFIRASEKDAERYSWSTSNNLSIYQSAVYTMGKSRLLLNVCVPLIGLSSRPGDKSSDQNTTDGLLYDSYSRLFITSWHNQKKVSATLALRRNLNEKLQIALSGYFEYHSLKSDHAWMEKSIGLSGGISWLLK